MNKISFKAKINIDEKLKKMDNGKRALIVISIIMFFTIIVSLPIFQKNYNLYADDGVFHFFRIVGTENILKSKEFLPLIIPNYCNNFGYGTNIFYSPLTTVVPLIFRLLTFNLYNTIRIMLILGSFLSGLTMYFFIKKVTDSDLAGIIGAILYIISPYRLNDAYYRMAIPEYYSFIFLPMVFNGMYTIVNKKEKSNMLLIGATLLILSHSVMAFFTAILCFLYLLSNIKNLKEKRVIKNLGVSLILIILLSMFYLGPVIEHKVKGDYLAFDSDYMTGEKLTKFKLDFKLLFKPGAIGFYNLTIGFTLLAGLLLTFLCIRKVMDKDYKILYFFSLIFGFLLLFISSKLFPYENMPKIFLMIQFTFRFLELINLLFIVVASINISIIFERLHYLIIIVVFVCLTTMDLLPLKFLKYEDNSINEDFFNTPFKLSEITELSYYHPNLAQCEYLPKNAFNNTKYIEIRPDEPLVIESNENLIINNYKKQDTNLYFEAQNAKKGDSIELPYIYYLGYRIKINGKEVDSFESEKGFVAFKFDKDYEKAEIEVRYFGTNFMIASYLISLGTIIYLGVNHYTKKKETNNREQKVKEKEKEKIKY